MSDMWIKSQKKRSVTFMSESMEKKCFCIGKNRKMIEIREIGDKDSHIEKKNKFVAR